MPFPIPCPETELSLALSASSKYDALVIVSNDAHFNLSALSDLSAIYSTIEKNLLIDKRIGKEPVLLHCKHTCGNRLILSPTGDLKKDYDDIRTVGDTAAKACNLAKEAGAINPFILLHNIPNNSHYDKALEVSFLSICQVLWKPLEAREALEERTLEPIEQIGIYDPERQLNVSYLNAIESGRRLARDLCGTEPERMSPPHFARYCVNAFTNTPVKITIEDSRDILEKKYPLLAAVARASQSVARHQPRVIHLEYQGEGPIQKTLLFVGKAVTYDTGGADLKIGGHMAGMSRDKGGAAAVAGFMKTVAELRPKGIKVVAAIGAVRNSIGSDCFVADEIITAHSGKRVRIGNTDAEGRLVMTDLLSHLREQALNEIDPQLFTIATLTGHAALTAGPYTLYIENTPSRTNQTGDSLSQLGDRWGDCGETSRSRREDWHIIRPRSEADDVLSSNNGPSVSIARGHQFPMAYLSVASGLDDHGQHSANPLPYCHIDIAGSGVEGGDWQHDKPTGAPLVALAAKYLLPD